MDVDIWPHIVKAMRKEELNRVKRLIEEEEKEETYPVSIETHDDHQSEQKNQANGKDGEEKGGNGQDLSLWEQFLLVTLCFLFQEK